MSVNDVKFPGGDAYPNWTFPVAIAVAAPFFLFDLSGNLLRGLLAAMSAASVAVVFITLRQWRYRFSLWLVLFLDVAAHYWLISSATAHHSDSHFAGVLLAPVVIADILIWQVVAVIFIRKLKI